MTVQKSVLGFIGTERIILLYFYICLKVVRLAFPNALHTTQFCQYESTSRSWRTCGSTHILIPVEDDYELHSLRAVSYTHLDVYKRQAMNYVLCLDDGHSPV